MEPANPKDQICCTSGSKFMAFYIICGHLPPSFQFVIDVFDVDMLESPTGFDSSSQATSHATLLESVCNGISWRKVLGQNSVPLLISESLIREGHVHVPMVEKRGSALHSATGIELVGGTVFTRHELIVELRPHK